MHLRHGRKHARRVRVNFVPHLVILTSIQDVRDGLRVCALLHHKRRR